MIKLTKIDTDAVEWILGSHKQYKEENLQYLCEWNGQIFVSPVSLLVKPHPPLKHNCSEGCLYVKPPFAKAVQVDLLSSLYLIEKE